MPERQTTAYMVQNHTQERGSKENLIVIRSKEGEKIAYNSLGHSALKLYLALSSNRNGFTCIVSSTGIAGQPLPGKNQEDEDGNVEFIPMSRSTFTRAIKELQDYGFLVPSDNGRWDFYDKPKAALGITVVVNKEVHQF